MGSAVYTSEEIARRGQELYDREIRPQVETAHEGEFLALDVDTGDYAIAADELSALDGARARRPDAALFLLRIGSPTAARIGVRTVGTR